MKLISRKKALERFKEFAVNLQASDKIMVLFHGDADGLAAAVVSAKAIEKLRGKKPEIVQALNQEKRSLAPELTQLVKKNKINKVIIVDWNVDQFPADIKKLEKLAEILIIDHHKFYSNLNSKKTVFLKAHWFSELDPSKYPASKLAYDLFSELIDLQEIEWVVAVGVQGDRAAEAWPQFIRQALQKMNFKNQAEAKKALTKLTQLIVGVEAIDKNKMNQAFELYYSSRPKKILKSKLMKLFQELEKEMNYWLKNFEKKAEFYPELELVFYQVQSKQYIKSALINQLSWRQCPKQTVIVVLDQGGKRLKFSARRQDMKVKMNELLEQAVKGLKNANAGGHIPAAAGSMQRKDLNTFKENILSLLSKAKKVITC